MLLTAPAMMMLGAVLGLQGIESWLAAFGTSPESYQTLGRGGLVVPYAAAAAIGVIFLFAAKGSLAIQSAGLGVASIRDLSTSLEITVVAVPADIVGKIGSPYVPAVIPAGTYEGQAEDVQTATVGNFLITHDGVPEDTVYQMTRLLFENLDQLTAAHAAAKAIDPAKALEGMPIPLHPGAEKYYREAGILK